jgi:putative flippase GtrA
VPKTLVRFLTAGAISALIYFLLFALFWNWLRIDYRVSLSASYGTALLFHFSWNRIFTFNAVSGHVPIQIGKYLVMVSAGYLVNMAFVVGAVELLGMPPYAGMLGGIATTTAINFVLSKYWVFRVR